MFVNYKEVRQMSSNELTAFEEEIFGDLVEGVFYDYKGNVDAITPEKCKKSSQDNYPHFDFSNRDKMVDSVCGADNVDWLPHTLISIACESAWKSVNWLNVANRVKAELSDYWVNEI
ncbi:hypothetical protein 2AV2_127 [Nodularia phage vB_NpeS-2AV2]|uniref:Uncharacterized protein n=1 Tax=Nodularia phage vB_NpeS-2AV2 TaxID=1777122 RepID=A0A1L2BX09_9CAUD|nr:hypothetical protein HWA92_gp127 [Nodularia phage vB_NpeS-2AV2]ALY07579.1 hypothetical protein 2AV2_127 [Nodularia phage vB_NpeS-2AV2]